MHRPPEIPRKMVLMGQWNYMSGQIIAISAKVTPSDGEESGNPSKIPLIQV